MEAQDERAIERVRDILTNVYEPPRTLPRRLGLMAEAIVSAKVGPQARFFTRERVDEIVVLLREAEKIILEGR